MSNLKPPPVYKIILVQLVATLLFAATFLMFSDTGIAVSILLGGLVSAVPNSYFVGQAVRYSGASNARNIVKSFMKGEMGKMSLTVVLFAAIFSFVEGINPAALVTGFIAVQFAGILMSGLLSVSPVRKYT